MQRSWMLGLGTFSIAALAVPGEAQIVLGPWTFEDIDFADVATIVDGGGATPFCCADLQAALTGFSPDTMLANIGISAGSSNLYQLDFVDRQAINQAGDDLAFFDARYSADSYEIAVRPAGGAFTPFRPYLAAAFVDTNAPTSCIQSVWGVGIELDDFGLPPGAIVDALRFRCMDVGALVQGDPVMAAVVNGLGGGIAGDVDQISIASGGVQTMTIAPGNANAGLPYLVLGTLSGSTPGFPLDGFTLPLNVDVYTVATLQNPNAPPLAGSLGLLDASGGATATFTLPPALSPALAGLQVAHALVVIEVLPTLVRVVFVGGPATLTLVP